MDLRSQTVKATGPDEVLGTRVKQYLRMPSQSGLRGVIHSDTPLLIIRESRDERG